MLIDFHTHIFPDALAHGAIHSLESGIERAQGHSVLKPKTNGTVQELKASMKENGVDISVVMPIATKPSQHKTINAFAKEITCDKIISFGSIHPRAEDWKSVLSELAESGFRGIKLHPEFQSFYIDEPVSAEIVNAARSLGMLVTFHCGSDLGFKPPFHATPQRLCRLLEKTEGDNIIAAHLGGFDMWDDVSRYVAGSPVYMDISMTHGYLAPEKFTDIARRHGADKLLFGSDSPWQSPSGSLKMLEESNLSEDEKEMIKYKNAERLLKKCVLIS